MRQEARELGIRLEQTRKSLTEEKDELAASKVLCIDPATGKTSLIKALAEHTGRNVVNIPLSRIKTNQELMDIVFDQSFAVPGEG